MINESLQKKIFFFGGNGADNVIKVRRNILKLISVISISMRDGGPSDGTFTNTSHTLGNAVNGTLLLVKQTEDGLKC